MSPNRVVMALGAALVLSLAVLMVPGQSARAAETAKVGVVDLQRCLNESKMGNRFKAEFAAEADQLKSELEAEETALKALREEIEKQGLIYSETAKQEREAEYNQRVEAFKARFKAGQQTLQKKDQELTRKVLNGLKGIIGEIGQRDGYSVIVEKQEGGVIFMSDSIDVTGEVIRRYDEMSQ